MSRSLAEAPGNTTLQRRTDFGGVTVKALPPLVDRRARESPFRTVVGSGPSVRMRVNVAIFGKSLRKVRTLGGVVLVVLSSCHTEKKEALARETSAAVSASAPPAIASAEPNMAEVDVAD